MCRATKTDRFSPWIADRDANLAQVDAGLACWYRKYAKEQTALQRADYEAAENRARSASKGLWAEPGAVPPWDWRKERHGDRCAGIAPRLMPASPFVRTLMAGFPSTVWVGTLG